MFDHRCQLHSRADEVDTTRHYPLATALSSLPVWCTKNCRYYSRHSIRAEHQRTGKRLPASSAALLRTAELCGARGTVIGGVRVSSAPIMTRSISVVDSLYHCSTSHFRQVQEHCCSLGQVQIFNLTQYEKYVLDSWTISLLLCYVT